MKLYHFTNKDIKDKIKTKYFADNHYTNNDKKISNIKRTFFFTDKKSPEYRFNNNKYKYIVNIHNKYIYDLRQDKKEYKNKYNDIDKLLKAIKRHYKACIYNVGYNIVISFYDVAIIKKEILK
jgi:hypothetical protein